MSLLPDNYNSANFEKENSSSQFFGLADDGDKNTIRILGDAERPETFIYGYQGWLRDSNEKDTFPPTEKGYADCIEYIKDEYNERGKKTLPAKVWVTQIYNITLGCAQVWEIKQKKIREDLEKLLANPKWGDLRYYDVTVERSGKPRDPKTSYTLIAEPPIEPPSDVMLLAIEEARIGLSNDQIAVDSELTEGKLGNIALIALSTFFLTFKRSDSIIFFLLN